MVSNPELLSAGNATGAGKDFIRHMLPLFTAHGTGMREWNAATGEFVFFNDFFGALGLDELGVVFSDVAGLRISIHPDDRKAWDDALNAVTTSPGADSKVEYRICRDQQTLWLKDHMHSYPSGDELTIACFTVSAEEQHRQATTIQKLESQYRKLVNTLPDFIFVFDEHFIFQDVIMPEGMSLLHTREELIGTSGRKIFTPEVSDLYTTNIIECLNTRQLKEIEYYLLINNIKYYFQARIVPFEDNKVFALIHDMGDRVRRMEELLEARRRAEEADRQKSAFLANMSHEIRTPLNAIVGFTEVVAMEDDPQARAEYMDVIRNNNNLLLQLINDILDLSRIESGKCEIKFQNTEINHLIEEVRQIHQYKMNPGVELHVEHPEGEIWAVTDHNRITQILFNLLSNAIKNTVAGTITLKVEIVDHHLKFSVTDTGRGIPAEKVSTIFNRFEKVDETAKGTGLGLAISQSLVERLGGEIWAESEYGKGATFHFTIPYRADASPMPDTDTRNNCGPVRKRILVADDSRENFTFISETLHKVYDNIEVLWAANGEEAVNDFVIERTDLILMNIQLPVMTGIEATKKIRAMSSRVPIIGITANAFYMEQQWALESGCNDIISKPYSASKLEEITLAFIPDITPKKRR